jgi:hypothetical protein
MTRKKRLGTWRWIMHKETLDMNSGEIRRESLKKEKQAKEEK